MSELANQTRKNLAPSSSSGRRGGGTTETARSLGFVLTFWGGLGTTIFLCGWLLCSGGKTKIVSQSASGDMPVVGRTAQVSFPISVKAGRQDGLFERISTTMQTLQTETEPGQRETIIESLLASLATEEIPAALEILKNLAASEQAADLQRRLVRLWAKTDPQAAALWSGKLPAGELRNQALDQVAIVWANEDFPYAAGWARQLPEAERNLAVNAVATEAIRTKPAEALQLAAELPPSDARIDLFRRGAGEWAAVDSQAAADWAMQIADDTLREQVVAAAATAWSDKDPVAAANFAVNELPAGQLQSDTVVAIVQRWAQQQPERASEWVAQFPNGALRDAAVDNLAGQWSQRDPASAARWRGKMMATVSRF